MLGLKRVSASWDASQASTDSDCSDSDSDCEMMPTLVHSSPTAQKHFAMLVVNSEQGLVSEFRSHYPTESSRLKLARQIDTGHAFTTPVPYQVTLHEFADWRAGPSFDNFVQALVPAASQHTMYAYDVSSFRDADWDGAAAADLPCPHTHSGLMGFGPASFNDEHGNSTLDSYAVKKPWQRILAEQHQSSSSSSNNARDCNTSDTPCSTASSNR
jgi:hypothetical protein